MRVARHGARRQPGAGLAAEVDELHATGWAVLDSADNREIGEFLQLARVGRNCPLADLLRTPCGLEHKGNPRRPYG